MVSKVARALGIAGIAGVAGAWGCGSPQSGDDDFASDGALASVSLGADPSTTSSSSSTTTDPGFQPCASSEARGTNFSYIWLANSDEGTISKIDTETGVELGRYFSRPDGEGNPSRTSVNADGDVVVANRAGGLTKIYAQASDCVESNGVPGIQTSTGPDDVLAWGEEECVAWYTDVGHNNNRPVAWTSGQLDESTCKHEGADVFTAYHNTDIEGSIKIARLDGRTGERIEEIPMPEIGVERHGLYGAAVDGENNAWFSQRYGTHLVRVNEIDNSVDTWEAGPEHTGYGMTVTYDGYVWLCGVETHRFDPATEQWDSVPTPELVVEEPNTGGCMGDGRGTMYRASHGNVVGIDTQTLEVVSIIPAGQPGDRHIWGVAVDFYGFVWAVPFLGDRAYRLDPSGLEPRLTVEGLAGAYTYSDMTGFALFSVAVQPG